MECISTLFSVTLAACPDNIIVKGGLAPLAPFFAQIVDKFNNKYILGINTDESGDLIVPASICPGGSFNAFSGSYVLRVFDANHSGLSLTFQGEDYEGVIISFQETIDPDGYENNIIQ